MEIDDVKRKQPDSLRKPILSLFNVLAVCIVLVIAAGIMFVAFSGEDAGWMITHQATILIGCGFILIILILALAVNRFFAARVLKPLGALRDGVGHFFQGGLEHRIPIAENDEIGIACETLNRMAEELQERLTALEKERDEALETSHFKGQLLINVNHDLRTPLSAILGYTVMLKDGVMGAVNDEQRSILERIIASVTRLMSLVNSLLDEAQIEARTLTLNHEAFSVRDLVADIHSNMLILAEFKPVTVNSDVAPDVPEKILGDNQRIHQILMNLMGNAVKFTQKGEARLRVFLPNDSHWAIEVSDTGPGIPIEDQESIFEPFRRRKDVSAKKESGTGLGLSIVRQLTELMGGAIYLQSTEGKGSTFTIILPLYTEEVAFQKE
jgi:signal transduction histidine kinase